MRRLMACLAVAGFAGPVAACLNDVELPSHEREFRVQYRGPAAPPAPPAESPGGPAPGLLIGIGAVLLTGAAALVLTGNRARA